MATGTTKKAATKKAAATPDDKSSGTSTKVDNPAPEGEATVKGGDVAGNSGPGTGVEAPADAAPEYPSTTLVESASGPLAPPEDAKTQTEPTAGHPESSNDPVHAAVGGLSFAGERHEGLVGEDGEPVKSGDLFEKGDDSKTFRVVKQRIFEVFYYPNTTETSQRLLFTAGQHVNRADAARIQAALEAATKAKDERA